MPKIIQVSDLHLTPAGVSHLGCNPRVRLEAAIDSINNEHADADLVVFTGDLTALGQGAAYVALAECLKALRVPFRLCLGNGDHRGRFLEVFKEVPIDEAGFVQTAVKIGHHTVICLDTLSSDGGHSGELCERRLGWLDARLKDCAGGPALLFMHHPPFEVGMPFLDSLALKHPERLAAVLAPHDITHIFLGHLHRPIAGSWRRIPMSVVRSTVSQFALRLGGPPARCLEAPFYAVALVSDESVVVHFHDYMFDGTVMKYEPVPAVIVDNEAVAYEYQKGRS